MPQYIVLETTLTVAHEEQDPGRTEDRTTSSFSATRVLKCAWDDRRTLELELLGNVAADTDTIIFTRGHRFPDFTKALVVSVNTKGFGGSRKTATADADVIEYEFAELTVRYEVPDGENTPSQDDQSDDEAVLITESLEPSAEFLTLPGRELFFCETPDADGKCVAGTKLPVPEGLGISKIKMFVDWVYTIHRNTFIPPEFFDPASPIIGKVNDICLRSKRLSFGDKFIEFGPETLLMQAPSLDREITTEGTQAWRITVRMTWNPEGWNKFQRVANVAPSKLVDSGGLPQDIYELTDFRNVISADLGTCVGL